MNQNKGIVILFLILFYSTGKRHQKANDAKKKGLLSCRGALKSQMSAINRGCSAPNSAEINKLKQVTQNQRNVTIRCHKCFQLKIMTAPVSY